MNRTDAALFKQLDVDLRLEAKNHLWWSRVTGDIEYVESLDNNDYWMKPSGDIIDRATKPAPNGFGDVMLVPMQMQLAGVGTYGDATLIGREEPTARKVAAVHWNQIRHAVPMQEGMMDLIREEPWKAYELCRPQLAEWHAQMENWEITSALMEGVDEHISTPTADPTYGQGLGCAKRLHPNLYTWTGASDAAGALARIAQTAGEFQFR